MKHLALALTLLVAGTTAASAQRAATGRVFDDTTGCPLAGVSIHVVGGPAQALTNTQGRYRLTGLPTTDFMLEATRTGYQPHRTLNIAPTDSSVRVDFSLLRATGDSARPQSYPRRKCQLEPTGPGGP